MMENHFYCILPEVSKELKNNVQDHPVEIARPSSSVHGDELVISYSIYLFAYYKQTAAGLYKTKG